MLQGRTRWKISPTFPSPPAARLYQDFESYYSDVSAATPSDGYFCLLVRTCWGLGQAAAAAAASASAASTTAATPGTTAAGETNVRLSGDHDPANTRRTYSKARTSAPPGVLPGTAARSSDAASAAARRGSRAGTRTPTAGVAAILRKLGAEVQGNGAAWGLAGLRRTLFDADRYVYYSSTRGES